MVGINLTDITCYNTWRAANQRNVPSPPLLYIVILQSPPPSHLYTLSFPLTIIRQLQRVMRQGRSFSIYLSNLSHSCLYVSVSLLDQSVLHTVLYIFVSFLHIILRIIIIIIMHLNKVYYCFSLYSFDVLFTFINNLLLFIVFKILSIYLIN